MEQVDQYRTDIQTSIDSYEALTQTQEEADETKETQTEPEPEDGRTRFRKKEAL